MNLVCLDGPIQGLFQYGVFVAVSIGTVRIIDPRYFWQSVGLMAVFLPISILFARTWLLTTLVPRTGRWIVIGLSTTMIVSLTASSSSVRDAVVQFWVNTPVLLAAFGMADRFGRSRK